MQSSDLMPFARRAMHLARTEFAALGALLIIAFGVMTFVEVADDMTEADGQAFDQMVLSALRPFADDPGRPWGPWWLKEAAADLTSLGGISVLTLFAAIVIVFLISQRKRLSALLLVLGLIGGVALSEGLKAFFERARPPAVYQATETLNASFPSGHALLSAVFYLSLGVMLTRAFPEKHFKAYVLGVAILITLLVGLTRIYLGAHWASDVFAGWSVGAAWAMALWLVSYAVERRQKTHHAALQDAPSPTTEGGAAVLSE
ncbi:phosphatase PAP2 family protein [Brevundimonas sp.]|jgi:undecaprenyl-diphosphatase|uniref:phosphatase PAP2 family protein n=1 Tax=Brevundimonas sp. TaxID=1871086 RepID=UPI003784B2CB